MSTFQELREESCSKFDDKALSNSSERLQKVFIKDICENFLRGIIKSSKFNFQAPSVDRVSGERERERENESSTRLKR